jgi:preprotein translocase subunit SecB
MMTEDSRPNGGAPAPITLNILAQYTKNFSFENPNTADFIARPPQAQPQFDIKVNVNTRSLVGNDYEVEVAITAKAQSEQRAMFVCELVYAGVFRVGGISQENLQPLLMIECPRLIFPFARQILADVTMNGGYAPLLLPPVDFVGMYQQRLNQQRGQSRAPIPEPTSVPDALF